MFLKNYAAMMYALIILTMSIVMNELTYAQEKSVVIVAHKSVPVDEITPKDLEAVFLGNKNKINDVKITIITMKEGGVHELFLKNFVNKTSSQFATFWKKLVFTGKGTMPAAVDSEKDMLTHISKTKGAIGYVETDKNISGDVKVIQVKKDNN